MLAPRVEWSLVLLAFVAGAIATFVAWQLGLQLGPPDPSTIAGLQEGDTVDDQLVVDLPAAFLAWPIATLAGLLPGVWLNPRARAEAKRQREQWAQWSAGDRRDEPFGQVDQISH